MKRVLYEENGVKQIWHKAGDTCVIETTQDCEPIIEANKAKYNSGIKGDELRQVASIPLSVCEKWRLEKGINVFAKGDWPKVRALLNDPEWKFLRTCSGRV